MIPILNDYDTNSAIKRFRDPSTQETGSIQFFGTGAYL